MNDTVLALALCVASSVCYALGAIAQRRIALTPTMDAFRWLWALGLNLAGGALHVAALRFGPVTIVQPLGALTLVFALPMRREAYATSRSEWAGAALIVVALAGLVSLMLPAGPPALSAYQVLVVGGASAGVTAALVAVSAAPSPMIRALSLAAGAGIAFGTASALVPVVLAVTGWTVLMVGGLVGCFALAGVALSQSSYRDFGLGLPLAAQTIANPVAAIVIGLTVLGEGVRFGGLALTLVAAAVMACGVVMLARGEEARRAVSAHVPGSRIEGYEAQPASSPGR
ncbi:DMT family protein [Planotetraspora mira]|uniref:DMT family transporter n=1 Tax=Planotetraspora mira TaxID=58121 RepID=A0A8J3U359_9ACTN|nr:hypothetical protein [Planotetraspora mira]GII31950.1 hypothetical protein Pmi06nite_53920 [Planotetraspora mira]